MSNQSKMIYQQMLKTYPDVMNVDQVCQALGVSVKTGYRLLKEGNIKGLKVGRAYKIPKIRVIEYLMQEDAAG